MKFVKITAYALFIVLFITQSLSAQKADNNQKLWDIIAQMNTQEKIAQLSGMGSTASVFGDNNVSVFGTKGNERVGIPPLIMGHGITGVRSGRSKQIKSTYICTPIAIGCAWNPELYERVGVAIAKEMRALNQNLNLGPTLNVIRHPLGGRNWECYSEDPYVIKRNIVPFVKAMQSNGIICGPKHFLANNQETNRFDINNIVDERTLREIYFPGFKAAVEDGGALNIMSAYNRLNGTFMGENKYYLTNILRNEWGFKGFVLSDFGNGTRSTHGSINAGMNVEMSNMKYYGESLKMAVSNGEISVARLDTLLYEKLFAMEQVGMFDNDYPSYPESIVHSDAHQNLALEVAKSSVVLLKNKNNILPLGKKTKKIAVIGPNAERFKNYTPDHGEFAYYLQGGGSGRTYYFTESVVSPFQGIKSSAPKKSEVLFAQGCRAQFRGDKSNDSILLAEAVELAAQSDAVVLALGLNGFVESEGRDRKNANFPENQQVLMKKILEVNPKTILLIVAGSYHDISEVHEDLAAVLFCPFAGEKTGLGIASVLFGHHNPEGKLPFSYPYTTAQYPEASLLRDKGFHAGGKSNIYSEGVFVGYRYFEKNQKKVLYPFGHGLSYTSFSYSDMKVNYDSDKELVNAQLTLKNTGKTKGAEVVQVYIEDIEATVERPVKELKYFEKVNLAQGESQTISFTLTKEDLSFFSNDSRSWEVEPGKFNIHVGSSSQDIKLNKEFSFNP